MNDQHFHNITNHTTPLNQKQPPNLLRTYTMNLKDTATPLVIKHNPKKPSSKHMQKKSSKNIMPKYLYNPPYNIQKQKLLFDIQKQNIKLRHQHALKKNLEKKLEKKIISTEKKTQSLQKFNKNPGQSIEGIERTITSSLQKAFALQPNKNYIKSIKSQIQSLNSEIKRNEESILKIKQSKKYTRYMENQEQKNTFVSELRNMKKYKKKIKMEINKLKRIHQEKKNMRIKELIMEGEIQNTVQMENINIYNMIQELKDTLRQITFKKVSLMKRKSILIQQIEMWKEKNNITDDIIEAYYRPSSSVLSMTNSSMAYYHSMTSTQYRSVSNQLNDLGSLRQEEQEDESMQNPHYQKVKSNGQKGNNSESMTRECPAVATVKVNSLISSEGGNFKGLQSGEKPSEQQRAKSQRQIEEMNKLQQKYFYNEQNLQSQDESEKECYDTENFEDEEGFDEEDDEDDVEYLMSNGKSREEEGRNEKGKEDDEKIKDKEWRNNNNRQSRGISV